MTYRTLLRSTFAFLATLLLSATAHAGLFRAYVSSTGNDANACTLQAPCRLLPAALAAVNDGGEIWMLDSANYNTATVNINKSVSILAVPGAVGSVLAINGPAVSIATDNLVIALRNLVFAPLSGASGTNGVYMSGASRLTIESSQMANLSGNGVFVTGAGRLEVANSIIRDNAGYAVYLSEGAAADISSTKMLNNGNGGIVAYVSGAGTTTATVSDSVISGGRDGVYASATITGAAARIFVTRCTIQNTIDFALVNQTLNAGIAVIAVSNSTIVNNNFAWSINGTGSIIRSLGNNNITDNTSGSIGTLTTAPQQ